MPWRFRFNDIPSNAGSGLSQVEIKYTAQRIYVNQKMDFSPHGISYQRIFFRKRESVCKIMSRTQGRLNFSRENRTARAGERGDESLKERPWPKCD